MEDKEESYRREQLITYLGNKRKLLPFIEDGIREVRKRLGGKKLRALDAFSGSGAVSRMLKSHTRVLYSNDLESYSAMLGRCYLSNISHVQTLHLPELHRELLEDIRRNWAPGLIAELYAPKNDEHIVPGERVFYTRRNAEYLDTARGVIYSLPEELRPYFMGPLLFQASVHTNTGGVFKGFYKDERGCGQFGGRARNALYRILADIELPLPLFSTHECECHVLQGDAARTASGLSELDLVYLDPPYNQHPYGSNYFMLNLLIDYKRPERLSLVSGIPQGWNRSAYNVRGKVNAALKDLLAVLPSKYAILSYNSEGLLTAQEIMDMAQTDWRVKMITQDYPTYRASRNLNTRSRWVQEYLFILEHK